MAKKLRFTEPVATQAVTTAEIDSFTYQVASNQLAVTFLLKDDTGEVRKVDSVAVLYIPPAAQTVLNTMVSRLYTYLVTQGYVPAGTEED